eukprot:7712880-Pyramimonas_sp.AAC.2
MSRSWPHVGWDQALYACFQAVEAKPHKGAPPASDMPPKGPIGTSVLKGQAAAAVPNAPSMLEKLKAEMADSPKTLSSDWTTSGGK